MATTLTRFELLLPQFGAGTPQDNAVQAFLVSLRSQAPYFIYNAVEIDTQNSETSAVIVWGALTGPQAVAALGYLNTLNAALGSSVPCISWTVTSEP